MKKLTAWFGLVAGLMFVGGMVSAATTDTLLIRVTPNGTRSVAIAATEYNFNTQDLGTSTMSATAVDVENDGSLPNTYSLQLNLAGGTGTTWSDAAAPGEDAFSIYALFNAAQPALMADFGANDRILSASDTLSTAVAGGVFLGNQSGVNVSPAAANDNRNLWLRLDMPTTSSVTNEQQFNVVVTAN
jgi:hypothetical protein